MTAIVYCHKTKQVAFDSRGTSGNGIILTEKANKAFIKDGEVWIYSGKGYEIGLFSKFKHKDEVEGNFNIMALVIKKGKCFLAVIDDGYMCIDEIEFNECLGSGGRFAYCALDFEATVKEAVEYAITRDSHSGGKVRVFNIDGKEVE